MRICDDRYSRDRLRLDLALRFIRHEARTQTIRRWTGLTEDRIRKLYHSYCERPGAAAAPRPRGRSPQQSSFFIRTPRMREEAALLASVCTLLGALPARRATRAGSHRLPEAAGPERSSQPRYAEGFALCEAYEAYRALVPLAHIDFERLMCLHALLGRGDEIRLACCGGCGALIVTERIGLRAALCIACASVDGTPPRRDLPC